MKSVTPVEQSKRATGQYSYAGDFGLQFYNARWYDSSLGRFAQADTIVPGGVQGYDRYAYANNNPVKYVDPSGHCSTDGDDWCHHTDTGGVSHIYNGPCANNVNCTRSRGTFAQAGINYQKNTGCAGFWCGLGDTYINGHDQFDSVGPAQITDYEMKNPYGKFTDKDGHEQTALGLPGMNQYDKNVAMLANEVKLTLRLDVCVEHGCTSTEMVIVAALSIDEKISVNTLGQAFTNKKYKLDNPTTGVNWSSFISDQMGSGNYGANIRLIHRFTQEVQQLYNNGSGAYVPSDVDWNYITNTLK